MQELTGQTPVCDVCEGTCDGVCGAGRDGADLPEGTLEAARAWVEANTTYRFRAGTAVPPGVALFCKRFGEVLQRGAGVQAEALGDMSQRFTDGGLDALLRQYAAVLMPQYYRSARFFAAERRWQWRG